MSYLLGAQALKVLVQDANSMGWVNARLNPDLFVGAEQGMYAWVDDHFRAHHKLPHLSTFAEKFPEVANAVVVEPASYYLDKVEKRFGYNLVRQYAEQAKDALNPQKGGSEDAVDKAFEAIAEAQMRWKRQKYGRKMLDFKADGPALVGAAYVAQVTGAIPKVGFGWPYLDHVCGGGMEGGDLVSIIGRPAAGKSYLSMRACLINSFVADNPIDSLFVSMEMSTLLCAQRAAAMYTGTPIGQLKAAQFSSITLKKFTESLQKVPSEKGNFYAVDGNLAATPEDVYDLAAALGVRLVVIDGAYMLRNRNLRLDRYTKVAENAETCKHATSDLKIPTLASWQFAKTAVTKNKGGKGEKSGGKKEEAGLEDIGYSDTIAQLSSIVCALDQPDSVETLEQREVRLMKGRNGEIGRWKIRWDFNRMDFSEVPKDEQTQKPMEFI